MNKKIQVSILSIFIAAALIGSVAAVGNNMAFAGGNDHDDDDKKKDKKSHHDGKKRTSNEALQGIGQNTETVEISECNSGNNTKASCNNLAFSLNLNDGNNAVGQQ